MKHFFKLMRKTNRILQQTLILFLLAAGCFGCAKRNAPRSNEVIVYAYDSFIAEWGAGPPLASLFKEKTGRTLTFIDTGDAVQTFSRAVLEKAAPRADAIVGVDNNLLARAKEAGIARAYKPSSAAAIPAGLVLDESWEFTPFDWSYFALIYNSDFGIPPPSSLADLTKSEYAKKLVLLDPRVSTPGLGFVAWTLAEFGGGYLDYWRALKPSILSMASGWSAGYAGLFLQGEAPLVISYTTSPPYHVEFDNTTRYKALIFEGGHPRQIEFAAVLNGAPNPAGGEAFVDFLLSTEAQNILPRTQWMYPANNRAELPPSFSAEEIFLPPGAAVHAKPEVDSAELTRAVEEIMRLLAE